MTSTEFISKELQRNLYLSIYVHINYAILVIKLISCTWGKGEIHAKFIMGTNFCNDMTLGRQADNHIIIT